MLTREDESNWNDISHCSHSAVQSCHGCSSRHIYHGMALHFFPCLNAVLWITTMRLSFSCEPKMRSDDLWFLLVLISLFALKNSICFWGSSLLHI